MGLIRKLCSGTGHHFDNFQFRFVLTREEGQRSAGWFVYEWDTTLLAPGTYFCTLYINEEMLVKKSVKLGAR